MNDVTPSQRFASLDALRCAPRRPVWAPASLTNSATKLISCQVDNLSRMGCRVHARCRFPVETYLSVTFPQKGPLGTRVAWSDGLRSGLEFLQPLHVAVLDDLLRLFHPPVQEHDVNCASLADWHG